MTIRIYTSKTCIPCRKIEDLIDAGKIISDEEIELVDLETDEGFQKFKEEVLDRNDEVELSVPTAYRDGQHCSIRFDEDNNVLFQCPT